MYALVALLVLVVVGWVAVERRTQDPTYNGALVEERLVRQLDARPGTALIARCTIAEPGDPPSWFCDVLTSRIADNTTIKTDSYWVRDGGDRAPLRVESPPINPFGAA